MRNSISKLEARLYLLRALSHAAVLRRLFASTPRVSDIVAMLDLEESDFEDRSTFMLVLAQCRRRAKSLERRLQRRDPDRLDGVLDEVARVLQWGPLQRNLMRLAVACSTLEGLSAALDRLSEDQPVASTQGVLAKVLACDPDALREVLHPNGALRAGGMLGSFGYLHGLGSALTLECGLQHALVGPNAGVAQVLAHVCMEYRQPEFMNPGPDLRVDPACNVLARVIAGALHAGRRGVNILVWGPEMGKTHGVLVAAARAGAQVFGIPGAEEDGRSLSGPERLQRLVRCQRLLVEPNQLVVFDDADDMLGCTPDHEWSGRELRPSLAWLRGVLANNAAPCIWIMRDPTVLSQGLLDRYTLVLGFGSHPGYSVVRDQVLHAMGAEAWSRLQGWSLAALERLQGALRLHDAAPGLEEDGLDDLGTVSPPDADLEEARRQSLIVHAARGVPVAGGGNAPATVSATSASWSAVGAAEGPPLQGRN